ncbi:MAG TPA: hypothetical protein DEA32_03085 [Firmicutes bacterium]|nr:hypothetical protein [Bacillota bacterium]
MPITQFSTIDALMLGHFDGEFNLADVLKKGDIGVGARRDLDGELIIIDGVGYAGLPGGKIQRMAADEKLAFATVGSFKMSDCLIPVEDVPDMRSLQSECLKAVEIIGKRANNHPLICRVDGTFKRVLTRSFNRVDKPYPDLFTEAKKQVEAEFTDIQGTLLGFYFPKFFSGINQDGWHFHFISRDRLSAGGHCLDLQIQRGLLGLRVESGVDIVLPDDDDFAGLHLDGDLSAKRDRVENKSTR